MNDDLSNLIQNFSNTVNSDSSGELKKLINSLSSSNDKSSSNKSKDSNSNDFNFDINTIMQIKKIMDSINSNKDDPRANLLRSLKPYLKDSRKNKIDQYIQLLKIGSLFNIMKENGDGNDSKSE